MSIALLHVILKLKVLSTIEINPVLPLTLRSASLGKWSLSINYFAKVKVSEFLYTIYSAKMHPPQPCHRNVIPPACNYEAVIRSFIVIHRFHCS